MTKENATVGTKVVRTNGHAGQCGNVGTIIETDNGQRVRVAWEGRTSRTWVSIETIEDAQIPYEIIRYESVNKSGIKWPRAKYQQVKGIQ